MASHSSSRSSTRRSKRHRCWAAPAAAAATASFSLLLQLLGMTAPTTTAYLPADGQGQECRLLLADETAFSLPPDLEGGDLPAVMLVGDQDVRPLFTNGGRDAIDLGEGLTLRLDAWIPAAAPAAAKGKGRCVPDTLKLTAGAGGLRVLLPQPLVGWKAGQWNLIEAPVTQEAFVGPAEEADWEDLDQLVVSFACDAAADKNEETEEQQHEGEAIKVHACISYARDRSRTHPFVRVPMTPISPPHTQVQIRLVRLCKSMPGPSLCLISTTVEAKTDCRPCNCQRCHDCECVTVLLGGRCPYDECTDSDACPGAPFLHCCYKADCGYVCVREVVSQV